MQTIKLILIILFTSTLTSCSQKLPEIKYDSRGKLITNTIGAVDTIYFSENSAVIDTIYNNALMNMADYVKKNNLKIFMKANTHEEEKKSITMDRLNSVESYFLSLGLTKNHIFRNNNTVVLPISDDDILTEDEKKPVRRVILQIIE